MEDIIQQLADERFLREEYCFECDEETTQYVAVRILEECGPERATKSFGREPYRLTYCEGCNTDYGARMNNGNKEAFSEGSPFEDTYLPR